MGTVAAFRQHHQKALSRPLSDAARAALRTFGHGPTHSAISDTARSELIAAGVLRQGLGGLMLTDVGRFRKMMGG